MRHLVAIYGWTYNPAYILGVRNISPVRGGSTYAGL